MFKTFCFFQSVCWWVGTVRNCSTPYLHSILSITFNIVSLFSLILSLCLYLLMHNPYKLNGNSYHVVYEKLQKSLSGTVRFTVPRTLCLTNMRGRTCQTKSSLGERNEHCSFHNSESLFRYGIIIFKTQVFI